MRNLINLVDTVVLTEATGLAGRSQGDTFIDQAGNNVVFQGLNFYPAEGGKVPADEVLAVAQKHANELKKAGVHNVVEIGAKIQKNTGGFGIAQFQYPDGKIHAYIKYFQQINPNFTKNYWDNNTIPGLKFGGKSSVKLQVGYAPSDILTAYDNLTPAHIIADIAKKFGDQSPLTQAAKLVAQGVAGDVITIPKENVNIDAFRDLFCEMLHPVALMTGWYSGSAGVAAEKFMSGTGFSKCAISFDKSKTGQLNDSLLVAPDGAMIKISSKRDKGSAKAAASNLKNEFDKLRATSNPDDVKILKKFKETVAILDLIVRESGEQAPLTLAQHFKLITPAEASAVMGLRANDVNYIQTTKNIDNIDWLTDNLKKLWLGRKTNKPETATSYYHLIAAIANQVATHINQNTNFSQAASTILNNGALVQVYTKVTESADQLKISKFETIYPSKMVTGVLLDAGTRYKSGSVDGKFGFEILKNGAQPVANNDIVDGQPPAVSAPRARRSQGAETERQRRR